MSEHHPEAFPNVIDLRDMKDPRVFQMAHNKLAPFDNEAPSGVLPDHLYAAGVFLDGTLEQRLWNRPLPEQYMPLITEATTLFDKVIAYWDETRRPDDPRSLDDLSKSACRRELIRRCMATDTTTGWASYTELVKRIAISQEELATIHEIRAKLQALDTPEISN